FAIGHRLLFRIKILPLAKALGYSFFFLIFISVSLGYLHGFMSNYPHFLEGEFGFWTNRLMQVQLGSAGVGALLIFVFLSFLVIAYNMDFKVNFTLPERKKTGGSPDAISDDLEIEKDNHLNEKDEVHERRSQQIELNPKLRRDRSDDPVATVNSTYDRKGTTGLNILEDATVLTGEEALKEEQDEVLEFGKELDLSPKSSKASDSDTSDESSRMVPDLAVERVVEEKSADASVLVEKFGQYDPQLDLSSYQFPHLGLLRDYGGGKIVVNNAELEANKDRIVDTLANYNIEI